MSNYTRGDYREKQAMQFLETYGYTCWQTRQSRGAADIICLLANHKPVLVQVKKHATRNHEEWNALYTLASNLGAYPVWVSCTPKYPDTDSNEVIMHWAVMLGWHRKGSTDWPSRPIFIDDARE